MILILTFLSLLASDCKVHREPVFPEICPIIRGKCVNDSHYLPCTVVEKCDTLALPSHGVYPVFYDDRFFSVNSITYVIRCHPDTLVDSGVTRQALDLLDRPDWTAGNSITYSLTKPLDSAELADIREMLREWRVEKCYKATKFMMPDPPVIDWQLDGWWKEYERKSQVVRDSCNCLYGKGGKK